MAGTGDATQRGAIRGKRLISFIVLVGFPPPSPPLIWKHQLPRCCQGSEPMGKNAVLAWSGLFLFPSLRWTARFSRAVSTQAPAARREMNGAEHSQWLRSVRKRKEHPATLSTDALCSLWTKQQKNSAFKAKFSSRNQSLLLLGGA